MEGYVLATTDLSWTPMVTTVADATWDKIHDTLHSTTRTRQAARYAQHTSIAQTDIFPQALAPVAMQSPA